MDALPLKLYRNTEPRHARAFIEIGEILFRSLTYYRNIEDPTRRDENDGVWIKNGPVKKVALTFNKLPDGHELKGIPVEHQVVGDVKLRIPTPNSDSRLISCFSIAEQIKFGPTTIEIFDVEGFLNRVQEKFDEDKLRMEFGSVQYYDFNSHLPNPNCRWLQKDKLKFSNQQEFRVGIAFSTDQIEELEKQGKLFNSETSCLLKCGSLAAFSRRLDPQLHEGNRLIGA